MKGEKKPIYKRWWFIGFTVFVLMGITGSFLSDTSPMERAEAEIAKQGQEEQKEQEQSDEQAESNLVETTAQESEEKAKSVSAQETEEKEEPDKETQKAIAVAMKRFECSENELSVEKLKDKSFVVNLVADMGSGMMSTMDSLLVVKGKIKAQMYDEKNTIEEYWAKVEEERTGVKAAVKKTINPLEAKWNVKDTDVATNGNIEVAGDILDKMSLNDIENAVWVQDTPASVYQAPWKYYGQMMEVKGIVMNVTEYPPGSDISELVAQGRSCMEINILSEDETFGITFFLIGENSSIRTDQNITAYGLPVGYVTGVNGFGGQVTNLVIVGI